MSTPQAKGGAREQPITNPLATFLLLEVYDFSYKSEQMRMLGDFRGFHNKDNPDKQDVEQFVTQEELNYVMGYLKKFDQLKN